MKRAKLRRLIREVLAERDAVGERPIAVDTLTVDFDERTVRFRGRVVGPIELRAVTFPVLDTTHVVLPYRLGEGEVL